MIPLLACATKPNWVTNFIVKYRRQRDPDMLGEGTCGTGARHAAGAGASAGPAAARPPRRGAFAIPRRKGSQPTSAFTRPRAAASEARHVGNPPREVGRYGGNADVVEMARNALVAASDMPRPPPGRPGRWLKAALRTVERALEAGSGLLFACTRRRTLGLTLGRPGRAEPGRPAHASTGACYPRVCPAFGSRARLDGKAAACYTARAPPKRARRPPRGRMPAGRSAAGRWAA